MKSRGFFSFCLIFFLAACSSSDGGSSIEVDPTDLGQDVVDTHENGNGTLPTPVASDTEWVEASGRSILVQSWRPAKCWDGNPCPAVVLVPDKDHGGIEEFECCGKDLAAKLGDTVIITYNPPGRGGSGEQTSGEEDYGGPGAQDTLKDVINMMRKHQHIKEEGFGIVSLGNGVADAAGAVARFQATFLDYVVFLIDIEGPTNRCFITQSPYYVDPEGWYINSDGPGVSYTRCDFDFYDRPTKFPAGTSSDGKGTDGTPNAYLCHQNAFVIADSGKTCDQDVWWNKREAKTYLKDLKIHYLRLQFLHDHEQPTRHCAREALRWVTQADTASYQINNVTINNNLQGYSEEDLEEMGVYLSYSSIGNGWGTDVYDDNGDFDKISQKELMLVVLPQYIERMQKRGAEK